MSVPSRATETPEGRARVPGKLAVAAAGDGPGAPNVLAPGVHIAVQPRAVDVDGRIGPSNRAPEGSPWVGEPIPDHARLSARHCHGPGIMTKRPHRHRRRRGGWHHVADAGKILRIGAVKRHPPRVRGGVPAKVGIRRRGWRLGKPANRPENNDVVHRAAGTGLVHVDPHPAGAGVARAHIARVIPDQPYGLRPEIDLAHRHEVATPHNYVASRGEPNHLWARHAGVGERGRPRWAVPPAVNNNYALVRHRLFADKRADRRAIRGNLPDG